MTPQDLIAAFDTLAEAPNAADRLRELILELAVRGKLVPHDPHDEPASALVERIRRERQRLVETKSLTKQKPRPSLREASVDVPDQWCRVQLGDVFDLEYGKNLPSKARNDSGDVEVYGSNGAVGRHDKPLVRDPCVVVGRKGSAGAINIASGPCWPIDTTYFVVPRGGMHLEFAAHVLRAARLDELDRATAIPGLNREDAYVLPVLIPPPAEQQRIVARVDELMGLLDRLEAARDARETTRKALRDSALSALQQADTPEEVETAWRRIADNIHDLFTNPADIEPLRQTILQLAVRGRLVAQDADEKAGEKNVSVGDVAKFQNGYAFKSTWYTDAGVRVVRNQNIGHAELDWKDEKRVSEAHAVEFERFALDDGDIVLALDRPLISTGLKVARIDAEDLPCLLLQRVARPQFVDPASISADYFFDWLNSPEFTDHIEPGRSNGVPHISTREVERLKFRLPLRREQERIVDRVKYLLDLLAKLKLKVAAQMEAHNAFAAAAVHHLET
ncbi:MAG: restriction endonuclease subunit S [Planctomycetes bacterium]|nr:restriction endonuclease subunit S [Planctomycetota bacterium]